MNNLNSYYSSSFQFIPFRHAEPERERFICGGDIIKIKHTEIGGHLCVDGNGDKALALSCFVRKYRGTNSMEENDSNCLFEIEMYGSDHKGRFIKWKDPETNKNLDKSDLLLDKSTTEIDGRNDPIYANT